MRMIAERLPPRLETHLCVFQLASSSCFTTYPLRLRHRAIRMSRSGRFPSGMSSFLGHVHGYGSASLKQNTDLACYCSNQSIEIAIQGYIVEEGQVSDIRRHTSRPARASRSVHLLKRCQYLGTVLGMFECRSDLNSIPR